MASRGPRWAFAAPPLLDGPALPYYWAISGLTAGSFVADLEVTYTEADVDALGLWEETLTLFQSDDEGGTWYELDSTVNVLDDTIAAPGLESLGWFAIADIGELAAGDLDRDDDVDLADLARFQGCFTGIDGAPIVPGCRLANLDSDADVDLDDYKAMSLCLSGPEGGRLLARGLPRTPTRIALRGNPWSRSSTGQAAATDVLP